MLHRLVILPDQLNKNCPISLNFRRLTNNPLPSAKHYCRLMTYSIYHIFNKHLLHSLDNVLLIC